MNKSWCKEVLEQAMMLLTELENAFARLRSCLEVRISLPAGYGVLWFCKKRKRKRKKSMAAAVVTWWGKNGDIQLVRLQSLLSLMCREWWGSTDFMHFFFYASICSNFYISITFLILKYVQWVKAKPPRPAPLWSEPDWSFRYSSGQP